jgi:hypothetical protein
MLAAPYRFQSAMQHLQQSRLLERIAFQAKIAETAAACHPPN